MPSNEQPAPAPTDEPPEKGWKRNPGRQPPRSRGKRVRVILAHGREGTYDNNPMSPPGWAADRCNWTLGNYRFDIHWYLIIA